MILILKRITENTRVPDIEDFLRPVLQGGFLRKTGRIESLKIQLHKVGDKKEYHALVSIEPSVVAQRVIKQLNRKMLCGKAINIAEFHFRHFSNDRRQSRYRPLHDRRKADRRRKGVEIHDITVTRSGVNIDYDLFGLRSD